MGIFFSESEMARSSECRDRFAQKCLTPPTLLERRFYVNYETGLPIFELMTKRACQDLRSFLGSVLLPYGYI
jgi:hypothetical protein